MIEYNTSFVVWKLLKRFKIKISKITIENFLHSHPHYPSLLSICDLFKKWDIIYYPLTLNTTEIKQVEIPFIAHLNVAGGELAYVEKICKGKITYYTRKGKRQIEIFEEFSSKLSGAVILVEPEQKVIESNYKQNRQMELIENMFLPMSIIVFLIILIRFSLNNNINYSNQINLFLIILCPSPR